MTISSRPPVWLRSLLLALTLGASAAWAQFTASRNFRIPWFFGEKAAFQLRGEAFNAPNHVNLGGINTSLTSSTFGRVTSAANARVFAVTGRLSF